MKRVAFISIFLLVATISFLAGRYSNSDADSPISGDQPINEIVAEEVVELGAFDGLVEYERGDLIPCIVKWQFK